MPVAVSQSRAAVFPDAVTIFAPFGLKAGAPVAARDRKGFRKRAVFRDAGDEKLSRIPGHIGEIPSEKCEPLAVGVDAWTCIEILALKSNAGSFRGFAS